MLVSACRAILPHALSPRVFVDEETCRHNILVHPELGRGILDAVELRVVRLGSRHDIEPELGPKVAGLFPLVGRQADGAGAGPRLAGGLIWENRLCNSIILNRQIAV